MSNSPSNAPSATPTSTHLRLSSLYTSVKFHAVNHRQTPLTPEELELYRFSKTNAEMSRQAQNPETPKPTTSFLFDPTSSSSSSASPQLATSTPPTSPPSEPVAKLSAQGFAPTQHTVPSILSQDDPMFVNARNALENAEATIDAELRDFDVCWKNELQLIQQTVQRMYTTGWVKPTP
ncbi:Protein of unknown function [Pyronema omphalodes CBS 100304]|uniref:Uncharacterized protein n=1 Tax=Pyronema omphalodes (strain CBS 100304) TaxID=1076935 RepID=U4LIQ0_PYROM|nr:Protein of unknown function [Pyronema omphalodes CBS 100304]